MGIFATLRDMFKTPDFWHPLGVDDAVRLTMALEGHRKRATENSEIRYLGDLQRLDLKADDLLVVTCPAPLSVATAERIKGVVTNAVGKDVKVLVIEDGMRLGIIGAGADDLPDGGYH